MITEDHDRDQIWLVVHDLLSLGLLDSARPSPLTLGNVGIDLPNSGYVQWTRLQHKESPIHIEINEGAFTEPMPLELVDRLVRCGWNPPNEQFRNTWLRSADRPGPADLENLSDKVIFGATLGLGLSLAQFATAVVSHDCRNPRTPVGPGIPQRT